MSSNIKNRKIFKVIRLVSFLLIFILLYSLVTEFFTYNSERDVLNIYGYYLEEENTIDVVMLGASELYTGFSSPLAWKEHGFTSYSLAYAAAPGELYKSMLCEAIKTQDPSLVVAEINGFIHQYKGATGESSLRRWLDNIPMSANKLQTINECVPEDLQMSFYFQISKYHNNWEHPLRCYRQASYKYKMQKRGYSLTKTFSQTAGIVKPSKRPQINKVQFDDREKQNLIDFCNYCKENNLTNVLFLRSPHLTELNKPEVLDEIESIVKKYGFDFLNLDHAFDEVGLDTARDFYNPEHLNVFGLRKFTSYLGGYITENYDVKRDHSDSVKDEWNECAEYMESLLKVCEEKTLAGTKEYIDGSYQFK